MRGIVLPAAKGGAPFAGIATPHMRGSNERSGELFSYVDLEERVPAKHPLRLIRRPDQLHWRPQFVNLVEIIPAMLAWRKSSREELDMRCRGTQCNNLQGTTLRVWIAMRSIRPSTAGTSAESG
jgi:hypothetical protein